MKNHPAARLSAIILAAWVLVSCSRDQAAGPLSSGLFVSLSPPEPAPTATPVPTTVPTVAPPPAAPTAVSAAAAIAAPPTLTPTSARPTLSAATPRSADEIPVISPQSVKALMEEGANLALVDVRSPMDYANGHIKAAVNLPWDGNIKSTGDLSPDTLVIVYTAFSPDEKASQTMAGDWAMQLITTFGYKKVALLDGGLVRWMQLGYPCG